MKINLHNWPAPNPDEVMRGEVLPPLPLEYHFGVEATYTVADGWTYHAYRHHDDDDACTHQGMLSGETVWDANTDDWREVEGEWPHIGPLETVECMAVDAFNEKCGSRTAWQRMVAS